MEFHRLHPWDISPKEAVQLQKGLASQVLLQPLPKNLRWVACCDVSFNIGSDELFAAVSVFAADSMDVIEDVTVQRLVPFPYIPGLLSFRELPALLDAFARLKTRPDVIICDGQGIAHPRRLGIASHLGLWLQIPTVGSAKKLLCGNGDEPGEKRGDKSPFYFHDEQVGYALRTRRQVKPIYVSPGHLADFDSSVDLIMKMTGSYRIPLPIRHVHELSNAKRREQSAPLF